MPHITDAIQDWIERVAHIPVDGMIGPADVCVVELGGTIGTVLRTFFRLLHSIVSIFYVIFFRTNVSLLEC